MTRLVLALFVLLAGAALQAQTGALVSYQLDVFDIGVDPTGLGTPLYTMTIPASSLACNQAPLAPPQWLTTPNPQTVFWTDPVNAGKICKLTTVLLAALPAHAPGAYILTVSVTDDRGITSERSPVSGPFNAKPPLPVSGVGVRE